MDHTLVPAALTAFPVVLDASCLPSEMVTLSGANAAQTDGGDIRFSTDSAGATQLACEVVQWAQNASPASATAEIWVPLTLSSSVDTVFYVWYKAGGGLTQPAASAAFGAQAVWDSSAKGVWHLSSAAFLADSTASADTATNHSATQVTAKLNGGANFVAASSQYIDAPFVSGWDGNAQSASAWLKTSTTGTLKNIVRRDNTVGSRNWLLRVNTSNFLESGLIWGGNSFTTSNPTTVTDGVWHLAHLVFSYDGVHSNGILYLDGVAVGSAMQVTGAQPSTSQLLDIGRASNVSNEYMNGVIDEAHLATTNRSANWILGEYHNQNNPGVFTTAGTPVSVTAFCVNPILSIDTFMGVCG